MSVDLSQFSLEGKAALVTGGGRGIGRAIALGLARAGADVAVCGRTVSDIEQAAQEIRALGRKSLAVKADMLVQSQIENVVNRTVAEFGAIDILVNNAGTGVVSRLMDVTESDWDKVIDLDLKAVFFCCQTVARIMKQKGGGSIINIASTAAVRANPILVSYCVAKAGQVMVTRALAVDLGRYNIRVNGIGPAAVKTEMTEGAWKNPAELKRMVDPIPLGRIAEPEEMVGPVVFLASAASGYITGQTIYADGGVIGSSMGIVPPFFR